MMAVLSSFAVPSRKGLEACGDGALRWRDARHCSMRRALSGADDDIGACSVVSDAPVACESVSHRAGVVVGSEKRAVEAIFNGRWVWFPSSLHFDARNGSKKKLGDKLGFFSIIRSRA